MKSNKEIFVDSTALFYAVFADIDIDKHSNAQKCLKKLYEKKYSIFVSTQVLQEFYYAATCQQFIKEPISPEKASSLLEYFTSVFRVLPFTSEVLTQQQRFCQSYRLAGAQVYTASVVAAAISCGAGNIISCDPQAFAPFGEIQVFTPKQALKEL